MSRSGYCSLDDCYDPKDIAMWRGQVASAIRGKRGQAFLRELIYALDALPEKRLIAHELQQEHNYYFWLGAETLEPTVNPVCALGSVGIRRGIDLTTLDLEDYNTIATTFGIAHQLVQEIEFENDEQLSVNVSPECRWQHIRDWAVSHLKG